MHRYFIPVYMYPENDLALRPADHHRRLYDLESPGRGGRTKTTSMPRRHNTSVFVRTRDSNRVARFNRINDQMDSDRPDEKRRDNPDDPSATQRKRARKDRRSCWADLNLRSDIGRKLATTGLTAALNRILLDDRSDEDARDAGVSASLNPINVFAEDDFSALRTHVPDIDALQLFYIGSATSPARSQQAFNAAVNSYLCDPHSHVARRAQPFADEALELDAVTPLYFDLNPHADDLTRGRLTSITYSPTNIADYEFIPPPRSALTIPTAHYDEAFDDD